MKPILLVGAGGHARACIDVLEQEGRFAVAGLVGLPDEVGTRILAYPVLGTDEKSPDLLGDYAHAVITIGQIETPERRMHLFTMLEQDGRELPVIASPFAHVSRHAILGAGTFIGSNSSVRQGTNIGARCQIGMGLRVLADCAAGTHMPSPKTPA